MGKTISFSVDKGGVGKTTSAVNVGAALAMRGYKTLLVDADQQSNLTNTFLKETPQVTLNEAMLGEVPTLPIYNIRRCLDIVPASSKMFGITLKLLKRSLSDSFAEDCRMILRRLLEPVVPQYDYIIIDCPPSDNIMTLNTVFATRNVFIVATPEPYCVKGVVNYVEMMKEVKRDSNKEIRLAGVLVTNADMYAAAHRVGVESLRQWGGPFICDTIIRHSRPIATASLSHSDIFSYAPYTNGAKDYSRFTDELINRVK
jgi:chromosome partitioning protein